MKQIYIYPDDKDNAFLLMQKEAIENAGLCTHHNFYAFYKTEYFLFNWYENVKTRKEFLKKTIKLYILHIFKKKILWVVHNKNPHLNISKTKKEDKLSFDLMKKLFLFSYKTIILCDETKNILKELLEKSYTEKKIVKIPHPNYIDFYKISNPIERESNGLKFLFIGLIKKYKNIDLLIDCFNKINDNDVFLTIAGKCTDENFKNELKHRIKNKNITLDFRYIPNEQMQSLIQSNDILILPYSLESSLNSGVIFLSFSLGRTVCSSYIGSLKEYGTQRDFFYKYTYLSNEEHKQTLSTTIKKIITDWKIDKDIFNKKGREAFEIVKDENSLPLITRIFCNEILNTTPPHYILAKKTVLKKHINFIKNKYYSGEKNERA